MKSTYQTTCPACGSEKAITSINTEPDRNRISEHTYCSGCFWCSCEDKKEAPFTTPLRVEIPYYVKDANDFIVRSGVVILTEKQFAEFQQRITEPVEPKDSLRARFCYLVFNAASSHTHLPHYWVSDTGNRYWCGGKRNDD